LKKTDPLVPTLLRGNEKTFPLAEANEALARLKGGGIRGAAILVID